MTIEENIGLLAFEPKFPRAEKPLIDSITKKMTAALHGKKEIGLFADGKFIVNINNFGVYFCSCGASTGSCDFKLHNGFLANPLAVHYLAYHRIEIPIDTLEIISLFTDGETDPVQSELLP